MQHDEVIWQVIRHNHCSFMSKITAGNFCRNPYNVTGICNRSSCPLANSRYATILEQDGVFYLEMKTIERAHKPNHLWERLKLPQNYEMATELINKQMMYWPELLRKKVQQRLRVMTEMRNRMRKLALKTREKVITNPRKEIKREPRREDKARKAAALEKAIERKLLQRLKEGTYDKEIVNPSIEAFIKIINKEKEKEQELEIEYLEGEAEWEEEDDIEDYGKFCIHPREEDDVEFEEVEKTKKRRSKSGRVNVEVEHENGFGRQKRAVW